jgi:F-type H+-transporting ATPase subunit epsilon
VSTARIEARHNNAGMKLKVLLPFRVLCDETDVTRVIAETCEGSFGLLPRRLDCVAALVPGILTYEVGGKREVHLAVDEGILVKSGQQVLVSVRRAVSGAKLERLREAVAMEFLSIDLDEQHARSVLARLESGFVRRLMDLRGM